RDVRADDLPAKVGEAHPRLALTADRVLATHLELEVHGGQVAAEREHFEADPLLLGARTARAPPATTSGMLTVTSIIGMSARPPTAASRRDSTRSSPSPSHRDWRVA